MLQGFASIEDIEPALMEQHQDLPEDEKEEMRTQVEGFRTFYNDTEDSHTLCASLIDIPHMFFNDYNFKLHRSKLEDDDEPRFTEISGRPALIASLDGLDDYKSQHEKWNKQIN